jgi:hypothetical protein
MAITSQTRRSATRFLQDFENDIFSEVNYYRKRVQPEIFRQWFGVESEQFRQRHDAFMQSMIALARDGTPDPAALQDGMNIMVGMWRLTASTAAYAPIYKAADTAMSDFRAEKEIVPGVPLSAAEMDAVKAMATDREIPAPMLREEVARWRQGAERMVAIAQDAGIDVSRYESLGLVQDPANKIKKG